MSELDSLFKSEALCHRDALNAYAMHLTHNERDAEDLVQDTLLKAYRHFDKYEQDSNCKAWLCRIMTNEFITQYRHMQREHACMDKSGSVEDAHMEMQENAYEDFEENDTFGDEVSNALENVPEDFKAIIIMADLQDKSYREISEKLSIPIGTVMSRLSRGRQILRKKLRSYATSLGIVR